MCLKALDRVVGLEGRPEVIDQLQAWFCVRACRRSGALAKAVPELGLPAIYFVPDSISAAQRELPVGALMECPIDAAGSFAHRL